MREKELRFALICYGGISLAVYMHGITKEIWRLSVASRAFYDGREAEGVGAVYCDLLSAIEANLLDGQRYADSFIAQRLKLPRAPGADRNVIVIGLDTNQAGALVGTLDVIMGHSPGSVGHIHPDQIQAVTAWVDDGEPSEK